MLKDLMIVLFAMAAGYTISGIASNLYQLVAGKPERALAHTSHLLVMVLAGPNVIFDKVASARKARNCSTALFWLVVAISSYWSFVLGLFALNVAVVLGG